MARLPKEKPVALSDPLQWIADGRWAGERRINLQDHECDRSMWFSARWATPRAPAVKHARWAGLVNAIANRPTPPAGLEDGIIVDLCCGPCAHRTVCGGVKSAVNCRTCRHVIAGGSWRCGIDGAQLDVDMQRAACDRWERFDDHA